MRSNSNGDTSVSKRMAHSQHCTSSVSSEICVYPAWVCSAKSLHFNEFLLSRVEFSQTADRFCLRSQTSFQFEPNYRLQSRLIFRMQTDDLLGSASFPNWKLLKQGKLHGKQTQQYFSVVSETNKTRLQITGAQYFPSSLPVSHFCLLWCLVCFESTKQKCLKE